MPHKTHYRDHREGRYKNAGFQQGSTTKLVKRLDEDNYTTVAVQAYLVATTFLAITVPYSALLVTARCASRTDVFTEMAVYELQLAVIAIKRIDDELDAKSER